VKSSNGLAGGAAALARNAGWPASGSALACGARLAKAAKRRNGGIGMWRSWRNGWRGGHGAGKLALVTFSANWLPSAMKHVNG